MKQLLLTLTLAPFISGCALAQNKPATDAATAPAMAALTATISEKSHEIRPDALGYNTSPVGGQEWSDAKYLQTVVTMEPGHLRYPAGTVSNYWDWRTGWFRADSKNLPHGWSKLKPKSYKLEDLKIAVDATGATPVLVLNMLTSTLDDQMEMLRAARKLGLPVEVIELGNEYYLSSKDYVAKFPTPQSYGAEASRWAAAIKAEFPDAKVAVAGAAVRASDNARRKTWNAGLYPALKNVDAVSLHVYQGSMLGVQVSNQLEETGLEADEEKTKEKPKSGMWAADDTQERQWAQFSKPGALKKMLAAPAGRFESLDEVRDLPDGVDAWLTEYNLFDRVGPVRGTWAHGLFAVMMPLNFMRSDRVKLFTFHQLSGAQPFSAIFDGDGGFGALSKNISATELKATPYALTATGQTHRLLGIALKGATQVRALEFGSDKSGLIGDVFSTADGKNRTAVVVNPTEKSLSWSQPPLAATAKVTQLSGDPRAYVLGPDSLKQTEGELGDKITLPAYSMTLIEER